LTLTLFIHLNALQEAVQPEGQTNFNGVLEKIGEIVGAIKVPVIVKETGAGISYEDAIALEKAGVKAIDVGGLWNQFCSSRILPFRQEKDVVKIIWAKLWDWGIPTAVSLVENAQTVKLPLIASGGYEVHRHSQTLALSNLTAVSQPILKQQ
jgi:isopentenyl-diphosphate delta-isomerase